MAWVKRFSLAAALAVGLACQLPAHAELLDGIVAAIVGKPLPLSILTAYRLSYAPDKPAATALDVLISDRLIAAQARRYGQSVKPADLSAERAQHPLPKGLLGQEWDEVLGDHLLAKQFLAFRFGDFVPVTREQETRYYTKHRDLFPEAFAAAEPRVRTTLIPIIRERREQAFLQQLRAGADVRIDTDLLDLAAHAR